MTIWLVETGFLQMEKKKQYKQLLLQYKNELDNINLYVSLNGRIKRAIDVKLRYLSEL